MTTTRRTLLVPRGCKLVLLTGAMLIAALPTQAQQRLGLGPTEGAANFAAEVGKRFTFVCPPSDGTKASIYGTDVYTTDSGICAAAIHAGVLQPSRAGIVSIDIGTGAEEFPGSTRNGVTTKSYGRWDKSYTFARDGAPGRVSWRTVWNGVPADFTEPIPVECPAGGTLNGGVLWGTEVYTKDSTICVAAVHAGVITAEQGGVVIAQRAAARQQYLATERFGIASKPYAAYADAFAVTAARAAPTDARALAGMRSPVGRGPGAVSGNATPDVKLTPVVQPSEIVAVDSGSAAHPTGVTATVQGRNVVVSWTAVPNVSWYAVASFSEALWREVRPTGTSVTYYELPPGRYTFSVGAYFQPGPRVAPVDQWESASVTILTPAEEQRIIDNLQKAADKSRELNDTITGLGR